MDWAVHKGSRIERLPKILRPAALLARNIRPPRDPLFSVDGMTTIHIHDFDQAPEFRRAYSRAVKAAGRDYEIPYRIHQILWLAKLALRVDGAFVELGTGRGFFMSAVMEALNVKRPVHLFDTFLPNSLKDGVQSGPPRPEYAGSFEAVVENFAQWSNVALHRGDVFRTLPEVKLDSVAFLHVDLNYAPPEIFGVRHLWPKMPQGAAILFDDYAFVGCRSQYDAINALAEELGFNVLTTSTGQGMVIK